MAEVTIDAATFGRRLQKLYQRWQDNRDSLWGSCNSLLVAVGAATEDLRYMKSVALHFWLFGYEISDTVLLFSTKEMHVVTSQKKATLLEPLVQEAQNSVGVKLVLHVRAKAEDGSAQVQKVLDVAKAADANPVIGILPKDKHDGKIFEAYSSLVASSGLSTVDASPGLADMLSTKDANEILNVKKAALLAAKVMTGYVVQQLEAIVDDEKKVKHSKLAEDTEKVILDPSKVNVKLRQENVDIAYPPIIQSGGQYDLKVSAQSDDNNLHDGVVLVSLGTRYSCYCANLSRTYIINPTKVQEQQYNALVAAQEAAINALRPGAPMSAALDAAVQTLKDRGQPDLISALPKNIGFGMGLEFKESSNVLSGKNDNVVRAGMVFNVALGVTGLQNAEATDEKSKTYALQVADTVVVVEGDKPPEVTTTQAPKNWDKISYTLKDDDEEEEEEEKVKLEDMTNNGPVRKALRSTDPNFKSAEDIRKEKQDALVKQKNAETLRRLTAAAGGDGGAGAGSATRKISEVVSYRSVNDMPLTRELVIQVDSKAEAVLLPIYGVLVPFHITTIKNAVVNQDGDAAMIRVTFNFGGAYEPAQRFPSCIFLKELTFRTTDTKHAQKVLQDIKMLRSAVLQRDKERAERATLVAQEKLVRGKRVYALKDLWLRPTFPSKGRKVTGTLEAHANGFRYYNSKGEQVDIMYRNIKNAFFQPSENEMITILHFHLINPIMVGNKKTKDIQVYSEVMDVVQTLDGGRRNMYDPDEIEEEQREREKRNKINAEFQSFVKRVQEMWEKDMPDLRLEFDIPFRELGFHGVPGRQSVFLMPTVNCLVELTEMPFTVVGLEDIEIVTLERAGLNLKNFDMAIVFKDFNRDVLRIDAIPSKSLDTIKEWLTSVSIKYYESKLNLQWKPILKRIQSDPEGFIEEGGWEFLNLEASDSEDEDEHSDSYEPSEEEEDEESDDEESDEESLVESEDEEDGSDYSDEEDEGMDWDELEEEARRDDKKRALEEDSDDDRKAKKRKTGGGGGGGRRR